QYVHDLLRIGVIADGDRDFGTADPVAVGPVTDRRIDEVRVRHDDRLPAEGLDFRGAHGDALDDAFRRPGDDMVADLERSLDQQDKPRHEIGNDVLQAEADTDGKRRRHQREARKIDAGGRNSDDHRQSDTEIADPRPDGIAHPHIDVAARQNMPVHPSLHPAGDDISQTEKQDPAEDAEDGNGDITDRDLREEPIEPGFDIGNLEAPGEQDQRYAD